jgi:hypothetical protein
LLPHLARFRLSDLKKPLKSLINIVYSKSKKCKNLDIEKTINLLNALDRTKLELDFKE